ncbi:MAG: helix-turn-helix domain-containing protein [Alphaproteobacteria bacterium]|nr:helix-turn-helix domain-containing protein [Alphaproteobacteria bacterium]MDD9919363.1 helix-turn-helix domain-containing protein [Alphaproteobacteria bacterium]
MNELLNESQVAQFLDLSRATLRKWRWEGKGPRFIKLGHRVMYRQCDIEAFINAQVRLSTSDNGEGLSCV